MYFRFHCGSGDSRRSTIVARSQQPPVEIREGIVIRSIGEQCLVACGGRTWECKVRGRLKKGRKEVQTVVVVGDRVNMQVLDSATSPPRGIIAEVLPRDNSISRLAARRSGGRVEQVLMANLDQVVAVQSLREPTPQAGFIDRLMVAAERFQVQGVLVLNKMDLLADEESLRLARERWQYFAGLGYRVVWTSVEQGEGIVELKSVLKDRISLLIGASGVGKSSLLNLVEPGLRLRVDEVTGKTGLGKHTTTRTELFPLSEGGFIADSPGIRGFDPWDIDPLEVREFFPDFTEPGRGCFYRDCVHRNEPRCGVKEAVSRGLIPRRRHLAYLALLGALEERRGRDHR